MSFQMVVVVRVPVMIPEQSCLTPSIRRGPVLALVAALFFGVSTPLGKILLTKMSPQWLGALVLPWVPDSGLEFFWIAIRRILIRTTLSGGKTCRRSCSMDCRCETVIGGIIAPVLLAYGLNDISRFDRLSCSISKGCSPPPSPGELSENTSINASLSEWFLFFPAVSCFPTPVLPKKASHGAPWNCRRLPMLGHRQQPYPKDFRCRSRTDYGNQRPYFGARKCGNCFDPRQHNARLECLDPRLHPRFFSAMA